jgi:hypothetical protein
MTGRGPLAPYPRRPISVPGPKQAGSRQDVRIFDMVRANFPTHHIKAGPAFRARGRWRWAAGWAAPRARGSRERRGSNDRLPANPVCGYRHDLPSFGCRLPSSSTGATLSDSQDNGGIYRGAAPPFLAAAALEAMGLAVASATPAITPRSPASPTLLTPRPYAEMAPDKGNYHGLSQPARPPDRGWPS